MFRKIGTVLLAALVATGTMGLAACSGKEDPGSGGGTTASGGGSPASGSTGDALDAFETVDLDGYTFKIAEGWYYDEGDTPVLEAGNSEYTDAIMERNKKIETKFHCKIEYEYVNPTNFSNLMTPRIMAGEKVADAMTPTLFGFGQLYTSNYLYDIGKLEAVDLSKEYWNHVYDAGARKGDAVYGISAGFANPQGRTFCVFFNKKLIEEYKLDNPYELVKSGAWTWDKFASMLQGGTRENGDGQWNDADFYACSGASFDAMKAFYVSGGNKMFDKTAEGKIVYGLSSESGRNATLKMKDIFNIPGGFYNPNLDFDKMQKQFIDGKVLFFINGVMTSSRFRDMEDEIGVVPLPKGAADQQNYISSLDQNAPIICVPSTIDNPAATGTILEALAATSPAVVKAWKDEVSVVHFRDEESIDMFDNYIVPTMYFDIAMPYLANVPEFGVGVDSAIANGILRDTATDPIGLINTYQDVVQSIIDEMLNA